MISPENPTVARKRFQNLNLTNLENFASNQLMLSSTGSFKLNLEWRHIYYVIDNDNVIKL